LGSLRPVRSPLNGELPFQLAVRFADATVALAETKKALKALENKNNDEALKALAVVTGKLDLIVARDPKLALTPVDTEVVTYDLLTNLDTIKAIIKDAKTSEQRRDPEGSSTGG
jgi:hypothetical protein